MRFLISDDMKPSCNILFFETDCAFHQIQLITGSQLLILNRLCVLWSLPTKSYFGSLAQCMNVWRETGAAQAILELWAARHGDLSAVRCAGKQPPRCIGSRWASIHECEAWFLKEPERANAPVPCVWLKCGVALMHGQLVL